MPISLYQCDVKVEIAFNAGVRTPAASYVWTDVSDAVEGHEGITIKWGRQDERSAADANTLTLVLDNKTGDFTAGKTGGSHYPNIKVGRPIRVLATPVDGFQSTRFMGFIDGWPTEWSEGTDSYAAATINATSRLSRLGTQAGLKSIVEQAILADSPLAYYTLGEPTGAMQANDSSGNKADPLVLAGDLATPVVFGSATGPGTDSLTAAAFSTGQYLSNATTPTGSAWTLEAFFLCESGHGGVITGFTENVNLGPALSVEAGGAGRLIGPSSIVSSGSVADGSTHHAALVLSGGTYSMYLDGALVTTTAAAGTIKNLNVGLSMTGVTAHVAFWNSALTSGQVLTHAQAGLTGYAGETTADRLLRYADLAAIPITEVNVETGRTTMQHVDTTDKQVVELMRICETTEGGVLYDERDGTLTFHHRDHRYTTASSYTLNMAAHEVEASYAPRFDATGLVNDVTAQDTSGAYIAHVFDGPGVGTSIYDNGLATGNVETASVDKDQPLDLANWILYSRKDPKERAPALEVDALAQVGKSPNCAALLATTVGTKVTVSNRPTQASSSTIDYFVEGGTEVYGPESLRLTFNVSPSAPYDQVLVVDDPVRGVVDSAPVAL